FARLMRDEDYPFGVPPDAIERTWPSIAEGWGRGTALELLAPSRAKDDQLRAWWARYQRLSASPGAAVGVVRMAAGIDVRPILPVIRVPTLVLHRRERFVLHANGRYLAEHIPGARFVELPGDDHLYFVGENDALAEEIEEFLTGARPLPEPDRVLATV